MNIIILPLLVLGQLELRNESWQYGPEIRYNVTYNATTNPQYGLLNKSDQIIMYNHATQMKCWPSTSRVLNCRLSQPTAFLNFYNSSTSTEPIVSNTDDGEKALANFNFQIRFNRFGIKELVVPSTISPYILDMIRSIVNQFHTGIDLTDKSEGIYRAWENFTIGDCFTSYTINLSNTSGEKESLGKWSPHVTTIIKKNRNLQKCRGIAPYFFGSRESWRDNPKVIINLKSSQSIIVANQSYFLSTTESFVELHNARARPPGIITMHETMSVIFDSVVPAQEEIWKISEIQEPASAGIVTGKWLHDDFSDENHVDEK